MFNADLWTLNGGDGGIFVMKKKHATQKYASIQRVFDWSERAWWGARMISQVALNKGSSAKKEWTPLELAEMKTGKYSGQPERTGVRV